MELNVNIKISDNPTRRVVNNVMAHFTKDIHAFLQYMSTDSFEATESVFGKNCKIEITIKQP